MTRLLTAAAFAALIAGPVAAQTTSTTQTDTTAQTSVTPAGDQTAVDPAADTPPATTSTTVSGQTTWSGSTNTSMSTDATTSGGLMTSLRGDVQVVANAPIPDTPENRARYGQPESRAGRAKIGEGPVESLPRAGGS